VFVSVCGVCVKQGCKIGRWLVARFVKLDGIDVVTVICDERDAMVGASRDCVGHSDVSVVLILNWLLGLLRLPSRQAESGSTVM